MGLGWWKWWKLWVPEERVRTGTENKIPNCSVADAGSLDPRHCHIIQPASSDGLQDLGISLILFPSIVVYSDIQNPPHHGPSYFGVSVELSSSGPRCRVAKTLSALIGLGCRPVPQGTSSNSHVCLVIGSPFRQLPATPSMNCARPLYPQLNLGPLACCYCRSGYNCFIACARLIHTLRTSQEDCLARMFHHSVVYGYLLQ